MTTWSNILTDRARLKPVLRFLLIFVLLALVAIEGYYIFVLRDVIDRRSEELNRTSIQIQTLRQDRLVLEEELHQIKKRAGEEHDGTTIQR